MGQPDHLYLMVKGFHTEYEAGNAQSVLDCFIEAYLKSKAVREM